VDEEIARERLPLRGVSRRGGRPRERHRRDRGDQHPAKRAHRLFTLSLAAAVTAFTPCAFARKVTRTRLPRAAGLGLSTTRALGALPHALRLTVTHGLRWTRGGSVRLTTHTRAPLGGASARLRTVARKAALRPGFTAVALGCAASLSAGLGGGGGSANSQPVY